MIPPLSVYLHFPWCVRKCPYCDFNSHQVGKSLDQGRYVDALIADLNFELERFPQSQKIESVFMGGGTPSLFDPAQIQLVLGELQSTLSFQPDAEITMEANPGSVEHSDFASYRTAGVTRLSLGAQSFNDDQLQRLGRIHSSKETGNAFQRARQGGFDNINIDLMFGLPEQTIDQASDDLNRALDLAPEHISLYQLTLEPDTVFYKYPPRLPHEDAIFEMQQSLIEVLSSAGFQRYEVSAFARDEFRCKHNLNYWQFGDYIGIGAGAHGKLTTSRGTIRRARKKHPNTYQNLAGSQQAIAESRLLQTSDLRLEFLMNALRLTEGFCLKTAEKHTGIDSDEWERLIAPAVNGGMLEKQATTVRCTDTGYLLLDELLQSFLPETSAP